RPAARPYRPDRVFRRPHGARPRRRRASNAAARRRAARSGAAARRLRGQRDRRREHGQRRPRPCDRKRQGRARPHPCRVRRRGEPDAPLAETRSAFMRYRGQGHEIAVTVPARTYREEDTAELMAAFEAAYRRLYSRIIPGVEVEVLSWVLLLSGPVPTEDSA